MATPNEADGTGEWYAFEKGAEKLGGGDGFADVWKRGHFAWEYKGKRKDLVAAYRQLNEYREALENPPLLVVSDMHVFEVHTNFTGTVSEVHRFSLDDLATQPETPLRVLRAIMHDPESLRPQRTREELTEEAADQFARIAVALRERGHEPQAVAHFLDKVLFCLFAEDAALIPKGLFTRLIEATGKDPAVLTRQLSKLFGVMSDQSDRYFGEHRIEWFDGNLFDGSEVIPLEAAEIDVLRDVSKLDWSEVALQCPMCNEVADLLAEVRVRDEATPAVLRVVRKLLDMGHDVVLLARRNAVPWYVDGLDASSAADGLEAFLEHLRSRLAEEDRERVTISTVHRYKGRERRAVVVLDAMEGSYPLIHPQWVFSRLFGDSLARLEAEERRLLYVALSRAQDVLVVVTHASRRSRYLDRVALLGPSEAVEWGEFPPAPSLDGPRVEVRIYDAYALRDILKDRGFRWDRDGRFWHRRLPAEGFSAAAFEGEPWITAGARVRVFSEDGSLLHVM